MKKLFIVILIALFFAGCSFKHEKTELSIVTSSWIGYSALFYAKEKGFLKNIDVKLIVATSLGTASDIFSVGKADMITSTQYEYHLLKKEMNDIVPIILLDRSNGGDMILSNKTISQLQNSDKIYAYLEINSINHELLQTFIKKYSIPKEKIIHIDKNQIQIQNIQADSKKSILIATYNPFNLKLIENGFHELASTKNLDSLVVIDSLNIRKSILKENQQRIKKLKAVIDNAIFEIQHNPKKSYILIKSYLENISYEEFLDALKTIKWVNHPSKKLITIIEKIGYKKSNIIQ